MNKSQSISQKLEQKADVQKGHAKLGRPVSPETRLALVGRRFGRLVVNGPRETGTNGIKKWPCVCDCGKNHMVHRSALLRGDTVSCGCFCRERVTTHGMSRTPIYMVWRSMIDRCRNPNHQAWEHYGGRGITVCERWHKFENFFADMGGAPFKMQLDRINNDGNYEPPNCRWATTSQQQANKRTARLVTHNGITQSVTDWAAALGFQRPVLFKRLLLGWNVQRVLTEPLHKEKSSRFKTSQYGDDLIDIHALDETL